MPRMNEGAKKRRPRGRVCRGWNSLGRRVRAFAGDYRGAQHVAVARLLDEHGPIVGEAGGNGARALRAHRRGLRTREEVALAGGVIGRLANGGDVARMIAIALLERRAWIARRFVGLMHGER